MIWSILIKHTNAVNELKCFHFTTTLPVSIKFGLSEFFYYLIVFNTRLCANKHWFMRYFIHVSPDLFNSVFIWSTRKVIQIIHNEGIIIIFINIYCNNSYFQHILKLHKSLSLYVVIVEITTTSMTLTLSIPIRLCMKSAVL